MSEPAAQADDQESAHSGHPKGVMSEKWVIHQNRISSSELVSINPRFCGGYSVLPSELA
jgi:hypothetical protein